MGVLTQQITVAVTTSGMPLRLIWQGQEYTVAAEPVRWYERRRWWENPARGAGAPAPSPKGRGRATLPLAHAFRASTRAERWQSG